MSNFKAKMHQIRLMASVRLSLRYRVWHYANQCCKCVTGSGPHISLLAVMGASQMFDNVINIWPLPHEMCNMRALRVLDTYICFHFRWPRNTVKLINHLSSRVNWREHSALRAL